MILYMSSIEEQIEITKNTLELLKSEKNKRDEELLKNNSIVQILSLVQSFEKRLENVERKLELINDKHNSNEFPTEILGNFSSMFSNLTKNMNQMNENISYRENVDCNSDTSDSIEIELELDNAFKEQEEQEEQEIKELEKLENQDEVNSSVTTSPFSSRSSSPGTWSNGDEGTWSNGDEEQVLEITRDILKSSSSQERLVRSNSPSQERLVRSNSPSDLENINDRLNKLLDKKKNNNNNKIKYELCQNIRDSLTPVFNLKTGKLEKSMEDNLRSSASTPLSELEASHEQSPTKDIEGAEPPMFKTFVSIQEDEKKRPTSPRVKTNPFNLNSSESPEVNNSDNKNWNFGWS
jgi:hypothetical protein